MDKVASICTYSLFVCEREERLSKFSFRGSQVATQDIMCPEIWIKTSFRLHTCIVGDIIAST